jgi:signal peptidase II
MNTNACTSTKKNCCYGLVFVVALLVAGLDQLSKYLILQTFAEGEVKTVIPDLWNLTLTFNRGAAFGLWAGLPPGWREAVLGLTTLAAVGVVLVLLKQPVYQTVRSQIALAGILGGAIGNVIDRIGRGAVVDFLDFYIGTSHWPAFNVADSAICIGVFVLILFAGKVPAEGKNCCEPPPNTTTIP